LNNHSPQRVANVRLNHMEMFVNEANAAAEVFIGRYGFEHFASRDGRALGAGAYSLALRQGDIVIVLTEALSDAHPAATYVQMHGDGVADIAFQVGDAVESFRSAVRSGAVPVAQPAEVAPGWVTAAVQGFGDVIHTFVQRPANCSDVLPGFHPVARPQRGHGHGLLVLDHVAVSLPSGSMSSTAQYYESAFGFATIFEERIEVGAQAMDSVVVQSQPGGVTLVLIEPDPSTEAGQIDDFLKAHGGPGVQHLAFAAADIVAAVDGLRVNGVQFLGVPESYYARLTSRLSPQHHDVADLKRLNILVDEDHDGQLFQIFTRSTHLRRTVFFEIIQRIGATTFGSGNIKARRSQVVSASHEMIMRRY
jgi:4-hydroxymandelate synthase